MLKVITIFMFWLLAASFATAAAAGREAVIAYHPQASEAGLAVLRQGGNAFDAFVAATAVEYVLGEGVTSLAGPLGAMLYDAQTKTTLYLDAGFNTPIDPRQKWDTNHSQPGAAVLVPGAVAGLEAISKKYGKLTFEKSLTPAIQLAENGFPLNKIYARLLRSPYGENLKKSAYGLQTYFSNGQPLREGDWLKLPAVANFLKQVAAMGSQYVYQGEWATNCIKTVNANGGHLLPQDFVAYQVEWRRPWHISYRNYEIYSARTSGGLRTAWALKTLERLDLTKLGNHFSSSAPALERLTRIQKTVSALPDLYDENKINGPNFENIAFSPTYIEAIWRTAQQSMQLSPKSNPGTHSYHIVVVDAEGNAVSGTNTIESFPWGKGLFVGGIPLTASGTLPFNTQPGARRRSSLTMQIGIKNNKLNFASGAFSSSMSAAALEFIVNIIDYNLPVSEVVSLPRFGDQAWDINTLKMADGWWLDPRVDENIVNELALCGLKFINKGYVDTGLGAIVKVQDNGTVDGAFAPLSAVGLTKERE